MMTKHSKPASAPRGAADATPVQASSGQPAVPWWVSLRQGLQLASQLVAASPVRLPPKVVAAARCLSLALGIWESLDPRPGSPVDATADEDDGVEAHGTP